ncbi:hypothetical protein ACMU_18420 [Actibacterium mucosum KCTC 23349]|uniref:ABC transporter domain-containing protein n=2 Tax=Actibacterium TaxID=1433986 RepID=A0A037ZFP4_9RHOB|nr:hypothetical protein ACMU_18420 [Actibacterium mucosum KCTC 23349]
MVDPVRTSDRAAGGVPPEGAPAPLLTMSAVSKAYGPVQACADVSMTLNRGEVLILVGENGAGKSTLMKILAGAISRDSGDVHIDGAPVDLGHPRRAMEAGIGIVHQELALAEDMSVVENLFLGRERTRAGLLDRAAMRAEAAELFAGLGVTINPDAEIASLSLGQRQMVEIARAVSLNSNILILDEPTASLESAARAQLFATLRGLQAKGVGIIFCSHHLEECLDIGDRVMVMRDGRKVADRDAAGLSVDDVIADMLGQEIGHQYPPRDRAPGAVVVATQGLHRAGHFDDVAITLRAGEVVGFGGLDGSGKVEVARALFGAEGFDAGTITLDGAPLPGGWNPARAMARGFAFLPGERKTQGLFLDESVAYNMSFAALRRLAGRLLSLGRERRAVADKITRLRVKTPSQTIAIRGLSGGNQQKVLVGRWMLREPRVLIFEEPTRGIDVHAKTEVYALIGELVAAGSAVLIVSSDLPELEGLCDRVYVFRRGRVAGELAGDAITQPAIAARATSDTNTAQRPSDAA